MEGEKREVKFKLRPKRSQEELEEKHKGKDSSIEMSSSSGIELPVSKKTGFVDKVKGYLTSETENEDYLDTIKVLQIDPKKTLRPHIKQLRDQRQDTF